LDFVDFIIQCAGHRHDLLHSPLLRSFRQSFYQGILDGTIYIEDFEDRQLNTPYVSANGGGPSSSGGVPQGTGPSVDEDDGIKDGKSTAGYVWTIYSSSGAPVIDFSFSPNEEGKLPTYVGAALLGGNDSAVGPDFYSKIFVYGPDGKGVPIDWQVLAPRVPPMTPESSSIGDRFAGIYFSEGISRIRFPNEGYIDHLQYGYAIPEPVSGGLLSALGVGWLARRTRPKRR